MELGREPFLKVRNIQKQFGHVKALRGVSVQAYQGEVLAIVGEIMERESRHSLRFYLEFWSRMREKLRLMGKRIGR